MTTKIEVVVQAPKRPVVKHKNFKRVERGRGTKKRVVRQKTLTWYKRELDRVFSIYIRAKYGPKCYTCTGEQGNQNGHWISRAYLATRWDEDNCRPQGMRCNVYMKGMPIDFEERLTREIGPERVQALKDKRKELWKLDRAFYEKQIEHYKTILAVS